MNFIIERRANTDSPWQATKHIIEADTANAALRAFGLRDAFASDRVKIAVGGKSGREYRAVNAAVSDAPVAAPKRKLEVKATKQSAPYGLKADGTPRRKPGRKPVNPTVTVESNHSDKPSDKPVYTREMRLANLAKGRAKRAANIAAARNGGAPRSINAQEKEAVELLARLDALQAEVSRLGIL